MHPRTVEQAEKAIFQNSEAIISYFSDENIILCILKGISPFKMHKITFFSENLKKNLGFTIISIFQYFEAKFEPNDAHLCQCKASVFSQFLLLQLGGVGVSLVPQEPILQNGFSSVWHCIQLSTFWTDTNWGRIPATGTSIG